MELVVDGRELWLEEVTIGVGLAIVVVGDVDTMRLDIDDVALLDGFDVGIVVLGLDEGKDVPSGWVEVRCVKEVVLAAGEEGRLDQVPWECVLVIAAVVVSGPAVVDAWVDVEWVEVSGEQSISPPLVAQFSW